MTTGRYNLYPFKTGEQLRLRKKHPCGGDIWAILRVGAEIQLQCVQCGRLMIMPRRTLEKAIRQIMPNGDQVR